jgi:hypothetical protein
MMRGRDLRALVGVVVLAACLALPAGAAAKPGAAKPDGAKGCSPAKGCYLVGAASRSINPDPDGTFAGEPVYLGGYELGSPPLFDGRPATGILGDGLQVRAFTVSDGEDTFAVADIEAQGWFVAARDEALGLVDMRKAVEERTGGALDASQVVVQSNHSHGAPDPMGVWGGVPVEYRRMVFERTVHAIVEAFETAQAGRLFYGAADARDLLSNQFSYDKANEVVDSDVRVLQARAKGVPFATLLNFSAHTTVLGSGNTEVTGDWVQAANPLLEQRFGGEAVTVVGTLGRTQPADRGCSDPLAGEGEQQELCKIRDYATRVVDRAGQAVAAAEPLPGPAEVEATS